ncbi:hypothetical protein B1222_02330 [Paenibacillus larvae subsp. pulvifaciens]|nr:hypothetical protein B1222_02330 [Paenibacillus larvae subsp. pulvifaciens]
MDGLGEWIEARIREWSVPGLAVAVVQKDKVLYSSGFGYRNIEKKLPVNTDTIFGIAHRQSRSPQRGSQCS